MSPLRASRRRFTLHAAASAAWAAAAASGLLAACGGGSEDDSFDDRVGTAEPKLRFVHAVPGGPSVTLLRNGNAETTVSNVDYKFGSQYYNVGTQTQTLSLRAVTGNVELATASVDARRGTRYTFIAVPAAVGTGVELLRVDDPYNKSVASDDARMRVVHAAPNAAAFDVYVTAPGAALAGATPQLASVAARQAAPASGSDSIDLEGGSYVVRLTPAGSKAPFFTAAITVPANGDWLLVVLPEDASPLVPNSVRVLLVRSDDTTDATDELVNAP